MNKTLSFITGFFISILHFIFPSGILNTENKIYDLKQTIFPLKLKKSDILIVAINDKSINLLEENLGRWPWERDEIAEMVEFIYSSNPKILIIDILMPNPSKGDFKLKEALSKFPHILALDISKRKIGNSSSCIKGYELENWSKDLETFNYSLMPCSLVNEKTKVGTIHLFNDKDGVLRRYPLWQKYNENIYPSLSNAYFNPPFKGKEIKLHFYGKTGIFEYLDGFKVYVANKIKKSEGLTEEVGEISKRIEGKIVLLGVTATGGFDLRSTPQERIYPGIEVHATALQNLMERSYIKDFPPYLYLLISLSFLSIFGFILKKKPLSQIIIFSFLLFIIYGFSFYIFTKNLNFPISFLTLSLVFLLFSNIIFGYRIEKKEKKKIKETFSRYVAPSILNYLLSKENPPELGGETKEITVLFSDIRNFTTISEKTPPEVLFSWLNEYFSLMVSIIFKHKGTLDKFIGDAIMAFWGAPLPDKDHSLNALNCAKEMITTLRKWNKKREENGLPPLKIGIGLNSGNALTGNIGADLGKIKNFQFTCLGDTVNIASRLEGLNKELKTEILFSESVKNNLPLNYLAKYVGEYKLKGKEDYVKIYTLEVL